MRRGIRVRLLLLFLTCITILTAINVAIGAWGLARIRDQAIGNSTRGLEQQAGQYLQNLALERANATGETLQKVQRLAVLIQDFLSQVPSLGPDASQIKLATAPDGRRFYPGLTTIVLPPGRDDEELVLHLADSQSLDILISDVARQFPEIVRISYLTTFGALRTYPPLNLKKLPVSWTVEQDPAYKLFLQYPRSTALWSDLHPVIGDSRQVISVVAPVAQRGESVGVLSIDISLSYLTGYLQRIKIEQSGFAFLVDGQGRLIAAPPQGQSQLLGRPMSPAEQGTIMLDQAVPALAPLLAAMRERHTDIENVDIRGRSYIVTYAPIQTLGWGLVLAAPHDEITASTAATSAQISGLAGQIGTLALPASLLAVVLLGLLVSLILTRQIIRPLTVLVSATRAVAAGDMRPIALTGKDEIGQLARSFDMMTEALAVSQIEISAVNEQLERKVEERTAELDQAVARLEQSFATQQQLLQSLREVSTPVIPVVAGVLAMPLIGQIDGERAQNMISALLARIERERADMVLLDITGVPMIDTYVAQSLLQMVSASRLLGAEVVLVGVSPEIAQTMVALGIDLRDLRTAADLRSAVEQFLARRYVDHP